jgi:hypothetical protein
VNSNLACDGQPGSASVAGVDRFPCVGSIPAVRRVTSRRAMASRPAPDQ